MPLPPGLIPGVAAGLKDEALLEHVFEGLKRLEDKLAHVSRQYDDAQVRRSSIPNSIADTRASGEFFGHFAHLDGQIRSMETQDSMSSIPYRPNNRRQSLAAKAHNRQMMTGARMRTRGGAKGGTTTSIQDNQCDETSSRKSTVRVRRTREGRDSPRTDLHDILDAPFIMESAGSFGESSSAPSPEPAPRAESSLPQQPQSLSPRMGPVSRPKSPRMPGRGSYAPPRSPRVIASRNPQDAPNAPVFPFVESVEQTPPAQADIERASSCFSEESGEREAVRTTASTPVTDLLGMSQASHDVVSTPLTMGETLSDVAAAAAAGGGGGGGAQAAGAETGSALEATPLTSGGVGDVDWNAGDSTSTAPTKCRQTKSTVSFGEKPTPAHREMSGCSGMHATPTDPKIKGDGPDGRPLEGSPDHAAALGHQDTISLLQDIALEEEDFEEEPELKVWLPDEPARRAWDSIYLLVLGFEFAVWCLAIFTYDGSATRLPSNPTLLACRWLASVFWFADMYVQMNTAVLADWEVIENKEVLQKVFVFHRLPLDGPISLPVDIILASAGLDMLGYWFMTARMLRLWRVKDLYGHSTPTRETSKMIESTLFGWFLVCCMHILSCIWLASAPAEELSVEAGDTLYDEYVRALYYTTTVLTSVGYGDFSPGTPSMQIYNIMIQILGVVLLMIVSGRTGAYFVTTDPYQLLVLDRKRRLEHVMQNAEIPWAIQKEAFAIYPSLLDSSTKDYQSTLQTLPEFIQDKITTHIKVQLISAVPMFEGLSSSLLRHIARVVEEEIHGSKEYLICAGDIGREMYFVMHGIVEVLVPGPDGSETWVATLKEGQWFGEIALLKMTKRTASVVSVTACVLFKLDRSDFKSVLARSEELRTRVQTETDRRFEAMRKRQLSK